MRTEDFRALARRRPAANAPATNATGLGAELRLTPSARPEARSVLWPGLAVLTLLAVLGGCGESSPPEPPPATPPGTAGTAPSPNGGRIDPAWMPREQPVPAAGGPKGPVAVSLLVFGSFGDDLGRSMRDGARLGLEGLERGAAYTLSLNEIDAKGGAEALDTALTANPRTLGVLGHQDSEAATATVDVYHRAKVLMLPLAAGSQALLDAAGLAYRLHVGDRDYGRTVAHLALAIGWKRALVLSDGSPHATRVQEGMGQAGGDRLTRVVHRLGAVRPAQIKAAGPVDGTLLISRSPARAIEMVGLLRTAGHRGPVLATDGAAATAFLSGCGELPFSLRVATTFDPSSAAGRTFAERFERAHGRPADLWAALAYDTTRLLATAVSRAPEHTVAAVETAIRAYSRERPYRGVTGAVHFDPRGQAIAPAVHLLRPAGKTLARGDDPQLDAATRRLLWEGQDPRTAQPVTRRDPADPPSTTGSGPRPTPGGTPETAGGPPPGTWLTTVAAALEAAGETGKPILVDFYSAGCVWCDKMAEEAFSSPAFKTAAARWILLRLDLDDAPQLVGVYQTKDLPIIAFWNEEGAEAHRVTGYKSTAEMLAAMTAARPKIEAFDQTISGIRRGAEDPNDPRPQLRLAKIYEAAFQFIKAAENLEGAQSAYEFGGSTKELLGLYPQIIVFRVKGGDLAGARRVAGEWIAKHPQSKQVYYAHYMRAWLTVRLDDLTAGKALFRSFLARFPNAPTKYVAKAREYLAR